MFAAKSVSQQAKKEAYEKWPMGSIKQAILALAQDKNLAAETATMEALIRAAFARGFHTAFTEIGLVVPAIYKSFAKFWKVEGPVATNLEEIKLKLSQLDALSERWSSGDKRLYQNGLAYLKSLLDKDAIKAKFREYSDEMPTASHNSAGKTAVIWNKISNKDENAIKQFVDLVVDPQITKLVLIHVISTREAFHKMINELQSFFINVIQVGLKNSSKEMVKKIADVLRELSPYSMSFQIVYQIQLHEENNAKNKDHKDAKDDKSGLAPMLDDGEVAKQSTRKLGK